MSSRQTTPEHRQPESRRWPVSGILDKRYTEDKLIELQADWESTTARASQIVVEDGDVFLLVGGTRTPGVRRYTPAGVDPNSGENLVLVEWRPMWRSVWGLSGALDIVAAWHDEHPDDVEPERWRELDLGPNVSAREQQCGPGAALNLNGAYLMPEKGKDYTLSLSSQFFDRLNGYASKASVQFLNIPVRQRVIFCDAYVDALAESRRKGINLRRHLRILLVYATGIGRPHDPCSFCRTGSGALPKCVYDDLAAKGACVNCAISGKAASCELHHKHRKIQRPTLWNPYGLTPVDDEEQGLNNGDDENAMDEGGDDAHSGLFVSPDPGTGSNSDQRPTARHDSPLNGGGSPGPAASAALGGSTSSTYATPESGEARRPSAGQEQPGAVPGSSRRRRVKPQPDDTRAQWVGEHRFCTSAFSFPCRDPVVGGYQAGPSEPILVHRGLTFKRAEASIEQVKELLGYCPCNIAEEFEDRYQVYLEDAEERRVSEDELMCKEECISRVWVKELNAAVRVYAPAPGQPRPSAPVCIELD